MGKMRRSRTFKKESENNVIDIDEAREKRREKRKQEREKKAEKQLKTEKAVVSQRRRVRERRRKMIYVLVFAVVVGVIVYSVWNIRTLKEREAQAQAELAAKQEEKERLQLELEQVESEDAVEQEAREQLHMIRPGETVYILPSQDEKKESDDGQTDAEPNGADGGNGANGPQQ